MRTTDEKFGVLYRGDVILTMGSFKQISSETGFSLRYLSFLRTPTQKERDRKAFEKNGKSDNLVLEVV